MSNRTYVPARIDARVEGFYQLSFDDNGSENVLLILPYAPNDFGAPGDPYDNVIDGTPVNLVEETKLALEARLGVTVDVAHVIWSALSTPVTF